MSAPLSAYFSCTYESCLSPSSFLGRCKGRGKRIMFYCLANFARVTLSLSSLGGCLIFSPAGTIRSFRGSCTTSGSTTPFKMRLLRRTFASVQWLNSLLIFPLFSATRMRLSKTRISKIALASSDNDRRGRRFSRQAFARMTGHVSSEIGTSRMPKIMERSNFSPPH